MDRDRINLITVGKCQQIERQKKVDHHSPMQNMFLKRLLQCSIRTSLAKSNRTLASLSTTSQPNSSSSSSYQSIGLVAALLGAAAATTISPDEDDHINHLTLFPISHCSSATTTESNTYIDQAKLDRAMGKIRSQFSCPLVVLNRLANCMDVEMKKGLIKTEGSQIKMLPSYVNQLPTGQENGEFLALDLGGSNFRVVTFRLEANKGVTLVEARKVTIPAKLMTSECNAKDLFGFIADQVGKAPGAMDKSTPDLNLGFTFSFPVDQKSINSGILLHWTKGFATKGCVNEEIVGLLQKELKSRNISVQVSALVNDTVGTLVANTIEDQDTHVGVILGTGCNACYTEKTSNILKMPNTSGLLDEEMIVNMEWGGFDSHAVAGAATVYDYAIDREEDPTSQRFEKQISGRYLGEITRKVCVHLMDSGLLFNQKENVAVMTAANNVFREKHAFTTPMMSAIESASSEHVHSLSNVSQENKFENKFVKYYLNASATDQKKIRNGWVTKMAMDSVINLNAADSPEAFANQTSSAHNFASMWMLASEQDRQIITDVCRVVSTRAARLAAAAIVSVVRKTKRTKCTVAVDGSVFEKYPHFKTDMEKAIVEMCGNKRTLKLVHAEDGSGKGAALIASAI